MNTTDDASTKPKVVVRAEQPYAAIPIRVTPKVWGRANALVGEVFEWLGQEGIEPAGPPFFRYRAICGPDDGFDIELGVSVESAVPGDGRVIAGSIPGGSYATLVYAGHPDRLVRSLDILEDWATEQGIVSSPSPSAHRRSCPRRSSPFCRGPGRAGSGSSRLPACSRSREPSW